MKLIKEALIFENKYLKNIQFTFIKIEKTHKMLFYLISFLEDVEYMKNRDFYLNHNMYYTVFQSLLPDLFFDLFSLFFSK